MDDVRKDDIQLNKAGTDSTEKRYKLAYADDVRWTSQCVDASQTVTTIPGFPFEFPVDHFYPGPSANDIVLAAVYEWAELEEEYRAEIEANYGELTYPDGIA
ncbi:hypothetical protein EHF33_12315 [Deinococcus psychrotolerans]|uniref:Uncharacterized protein n=1 Tax=Deinococcus psychrotolerans TaxID=2489213 RepID=A0A3G8YEP2_9DEIO|nr:hypothetical protein [Deinococcus psychrotolerans]AZI43433.1 hypothetical protein EHF33_12315 [Deinococcus psychrotolerans]